MKSFTTKLFAIIFIVMLAAGCASSITAPQDLEKENKPTQIDKPAPEDIESGGEMRMTRRKPR
jgi:PBP1b-binding outer membrane lipoprotein LpoB